MSLITHHEGSMIGRNSTINIPINQDDGVSDPGNSVKMKGIFIEIGSSTLLVKAINSQNINLILCGTRDDEILWDKWLDHTWSIKIGRDSRNDISILSDTHLRKKESCFNLCH